MAYKHTDPRPSDMIKSQLQKIEMYAKKLNDMIHPEDEFEGWVQSKIARVASDMGDVKHYLDYELQKMEEGGLVIFKDGTPVEELKHYRVGFTYEDENGEHQMSVIEVYAEDAEEAIEEAEEKYKDYFDKFEVISCDLISEGEEEYADGGMIADLENEMLKIKLITFLQKVRSRFPYKTYFLDDDEDLFVIIFSEQLYTNQADELMEMVAESPEFFDSDETQLVWVSETGSSQLIIKLNYEIY